MLREFKVPQEVELSVDSSPEAESDWADRKNLVLNATFKFTPTQLIDYTRTVESDRANWHPLPFPAELKKAIEKSFPTSTAIAPLKKAAHGYYYLKTADGKNLLKTSQRKDWHADANSQDIELAALNADSAELKVFVRQLY
jgi:hypothetical protein